MNEKTLIHYSKKLEENLNLKELLEFYSPIPEALSLEYETKVSRLLNLKENKSEEYIFEKLFYYLTFDFNNFISLKEQDLSYIVGYFLFLLEKINSGKKLSSNNENDKEKDSNGEQKERKTTEVKKEILGNFDLENIQKNIKIKDLVNFFNKLENKELSKLLKKINFLDLGCEKDDYQKLVDKVTILICYIDYLPENKKQSDILILKKEIKNILIQYL